MISEFCCSQGISWKLIPERAPHFGGLWEAAVKSLKQHVRKVAMESKLSSEEYYTVLTQVESCLNSHIICISANLSPPSLEALSNACQTVLEALVLGFPSQVHKVESTALQLPSWRLGVPSRRSLLYQVASRTSYCSTSWYSNSRGMGLLKRWVVVRVACLPLPVQP